MLELTANRIEMGSTSSFQLENERIDTMSIKYENYGQIIINSESNRNGEHDINVLSRK